MREFPALSVESEPSLELEYQISDLSRVTGQRGHHLEYQYFHLSIALEFIVNYRKIIKKISFLDILAEQCCYSLIN